MSEHELLRQAIDGQRGADQKLIAEVGLQVVMTLLKKNADYGSFAWQVPVLAPRLSAFDGIQCRMSDKVARLNQLLAGNDAQVAESIADSFRDLVGYGILWLALDARDAAEGQQVAEKMKSAGKCRARYYRLVDGDGFLVAFGNQCMWLKPEGGDFFVSGPSSVHSGLFHCLSRRQRLSLVHRVVCVCRSGC